MKDVQIVYKVVKKSGTSFLSARSGCVRYDVGRIARPGPQYPHSKLFCFDSLEAARRFALRCEKIYVAVATGVTRPKAMPGFCSHIQEYWKARKKARRELPLSPKWLRTLDGTLFADTITLIKLAK